MAVLDARRYQAEVDGSSPATIDYHYAYVDNMGVFGRSDEVVIASLQEPKEAFESRGFPLHEMEVAGGGADILRVTGGTRGLCTVPTGKRLLVIRRALGAFLALSYSTGM